MWSPERPYSLGLCLGSVTSSLGGGPFAYVGVCVHAESRARAWVCGLQRCKSHKEPLTQDHGPEFGVQGSRTQGLRMLNVGREVLVKSGLGLPEGSLPPFPTNRKMMFPHTCKAPFKFSFTRRARMGSAQP